MPMAQPLAPPAKPAIFIQLNILGGGDLLQSPPREIRPARPLELNQHFLGRLQKGKIHHGRARKPRPTWVKCRSAVRISVIPSSTIMAIVERSVNDILGLSENRFRRSIVLENRALVTSCMSMKGDRTTSVVKCHASSNGRRLNKSVNVSSRMKFDVTAPPERRACRKISAAASWPESPRSATATQPHVSIKSFTQDRHRTILHQYFGITCHRKWTQSH